MRGLKLISVLAAALLLLVFTLFSRTAAKRIIPTQGPLLSGLLNVKANLLPSVLCALLSRSFLSPSLRLFTKVLIHAGRGKIPSAQAHLPLLHCLSVPVFPGTPYISSTAIGPGHETLECGRARQKSEWEFWSHGRAQEGEPNETQTHTANMGGSRAYLSLNLAPAFWACCSSAIWASSNNSVKEVLWARSSGSPYETAYVAEAIAKKTNKKKTPLFGKDVLVAA